MLETAPLASALTLVPLWFQLAHPTPSPASKKSAYQRVLPGSHSPY